MVIGNHMKEKNNFEEERPRISLEELDSFSGREIEGLDPKAEQFKRLKESEDFVTVQRNTHVHSEQALEDFIVFLSPSGGEITKVVEAPHWRAINDSGVRSKVAFIGADGLTFRDYFYGVSTKGVGYLKPTAKGLNIEDYDSWAVADKEGVNDRGYKVLGLISKEEALGGNLIDKSEQLLQAGLRTELYWGMAELKRLPFKGEMFTVQELREKKIISPKKTYVPFEAVRLFKMNNRIAEAAQSASRRHALFVQAFNAFNQETKDKQLLLPEIIVGNTESEQVFFEQFFLRMAQNMAILLNMGHDHGYLHSANVTLAAEIADVGTIDSWKKDKDGYKIKPYAGVRRAHLKDMRDLCYGLRILAKAGKQAGLNTGDRTILRDAFFEGFDSVVNDADLVGQNTNPANAIEWMRKIFEAVIIRGENLPALLHHEVEDWSISV